MLLGCFWGVWSFVLGFLLFFVFLFFCILSGFWYVLFVVGFLFLFNCFLFLFCLGCFSCCVVLCVWFFVFFGVYVVFW